MSSTPYWNVNGNNPNGIAPKTTYGQFGNYNISTDTGGAGGLAQWMGIAPDQSQVGQNTNDYVQALGGLNNQYGQLMNGGSNAQNIYGMQTQGLAQLGQYANGGAAAQAQQYAKGQMANSAQNIASSALSNQAGIAPGVTQRNIAMGTANANGQIGAGAAQAGVQATGNALNSYNTALGNVYGQQLQANGQNMNVLGAQGDLAANAYGAKAGAINNGSQSALTGLKTLGSFANAAGGGITGLGAAKATT